MEYKNYNEVPWYRQSGINSAFILFGLIFPPFLWAVALILITGDVFYNRYDEIGNLKKWSSINKIIAWVIILAQIFFAIYKLVF